jgi:hypothetical protein
MSCCPKKNYTNFKFLFHYLGPKTVQDANSTKKCTKVNLMKSKKRVTVRLVITNETTTTTSVLFFNVYLYYEYVFPLHVICI